MKPLKNGLITGLILQISLGPVFFFIMNLTLTGTIKSGLMGVIGVVLADLAFVILAIFGVSKILEKKNIKKIFGIISSIVLIVFGLIIISRINTSVNNVAAASDYSDLLKSFYSTFLITIINPLTIVFFSGLFATKVIEKSYSKNDLYLFGIGTVLATLLFMSASVILFSLLKPVITFTYIKYLNVLVGLIILLYGTSRLIKLFKTKTI